MNGSELITSLVALNGGTIVGKTRLQKTVYLLGRCGVATDMEFEYYNYGPFSADLAAVSDFAEAEGLLKITERPGFYEVPYSVFETDISYPREIGGVSAEQVKKWLDILSRYTAIELELASTIDFLRCEGVEGDVDKTVSELKPLKSKKERLVRAHALLRELGIE